MGWLSDSVCSRKGKVFLLFSAGRYFYGTVADSIVDADTIDTAVTIIFKGTEAASAM
jgi:hypothetical protein